MTRTCINDVALLSPPLPPPPGYSGDNFRTTRLKISDDTINSARDGQSRNSFNLRCDYIPGEGGKRVVICIVGGIINIYALSEQAEPRSFHLFPPREDRASLRPPPNPYEYQPRRYCSVVSVIAVELSSRRVLPTWQSSKSSYAATLASPSRRLGSSPPSPTLGSVARNQAPSPYEREEHPFCFTRSPGPSSIRNPNYVARHLHRSFCHLQDSLVT